jgi:hypothetical protein
MPAGPRGAVAQLGERYNGIVEVVGSIPSGSTISTPWETKGFSFAGFPNRFDFSPTVPKPCRQAAPPYRTTNHVIQRPGSDFHARRLRLKGMQGAVIHPGAWRVQLKS